MRNMLIDRFFFDTKRKKNRRKIFIRDYIRILLYQAKRKGLGEKTFMKGQQRVVNESNIIQMNEKKN